MATNYLGLHLLTIDAAEHKKRDVVVLGQRFSQTSPSLQTHPQARSNLHCLYHQVSTIDHGPKAAKREARVPVSYASESFVRGLAKVTVFLDLTFALC